MRRIVLTGATGGLGRDAAAWLHAQGVDVVACGRNRQALAALDALGIATRALDLADADEAALARLLEGADGVWHCAALSADRGSDADFHRHNVLATANLARAAARAGVRRFVHVSTPALYFDFRHHHRIHEDYRPRRYVNAYARSKAAAEERLHALASVSAMTLIALRPRAIYGAHDRALLPRLLALHRRTGGVLPLPRGGATLLDMSYAGNVIHALWQAGVADLAPGRLHVYNISDGTPLALREILAQLLPPLGLAYRILPLPAPPLALLRALPECAPRYRLGLLGCDMTLDLTRARRELGYAPPWTTAAGIAATVAALKESRTWQK